MNYRRVFVQNGYVHIIITSYERTPVFIDNIEILRTAFRNVQKLYKFEIVSICILPDHIHLILHPENINTYPKIISSVKYYFSRNVGQVCPTDHLKIGYKNKREKGIFQRRSADSSRRRPTQGFARCGCRFPRLQASARESRR